MTDSNVVEFPGWSTLDYPVSKVLDDCKHLETVLVLGLNKDGDLEASASTGEVQTLIWLTELWKHNLLAGAYD